MARARVVGAMDAVAVELARADVRQIAVPDLIGVFGQHHPLELALAAGVEQAQLDLLGVGAEQREIHAPPVEGGAERIGRAGPDPGAACDLEHLLISDGTRFAHGGPAWFPVQTRPPDDRCKQSYSVPRNCAALTAFSGAA